MSRRNRKRLVSEINVVPYIDVMLVLLVIFMVTAPLVTTGTVDLPTVDKASLPPEKPIEVIVRADGSFASRQDNEELLMGAGEFAAWIRNVSEQSPSVPVVISADKSVQYEAVLTVMDALRQAGMKRVGLNVKPAN